MTIALGEIIRHGEIDYLVTGHVSIGDELHARLEPVAIHNATPLLYDANNRPICRPWRPEKS